jgi:hypothetical protein
MSSADQRIILDNAFAAFMALVQHPVPTHV